MKKIYAWISGFIAVVSGILGVMSFMGYSSVDDVKKAISPSELLITPKYFSNENIVLNVNLENSQDKKLCTITTSQINNEKKFLITCKKYTKGKNILFSLSSDDEKCYGDGAGKLGEPSDVIITCSK